MIKDAVIVGKYRYALLRLWDRTLPECVFIMLNPSTADAEVDDPTIQKCIGFAKRWHCGSIWVVNLFAWRATDPKQLKYVKDPIGPENDRYISEALQRENVKLRVAAWGTHGTFMSRGTAVRRIAWRLNEQLHILAMTGVGEPGHPLYIGYDVKPWVLQG